LARDVVAHAWAAYFEVLAARELVQVAGNLEAALQQLQEAAHGRAERGLLAPVEADIAEIARLKATQERMAAARKWRTSQANLALALGVGEGEPELQVAGDLTPITVAARPVEASRPEIAALQAEKQAFSERARVFRRARVPDVTLSIFAQRDGFAERVVGVGVALPLPLPSPVGRTFSGEIAEAEALSRRAETELERTRRQLRSSLLVARTEYDSRRAELELFTPERRARAEQTLRDLASEIVAGRLSVREAIMMEQSLIEFLRGYVEARHALCSASVALARASGVAFEGGGQ
jgi:cobalt-zinc-cadmium efflux system outer membrane protein